jgi:hypothetical protein
VARFYERTGDRESLNAAVADADRAVADLPPGRAERPQAQMIMSVIKVVYYETTGDEHARGSAVAAARAALEPSDRATPAPQHTRYSTAPRAPRLLTRRTIPMWLIGPG